MLDTEEALIQPDGGGEEKGKGSREKLLRPQFKCPDRSSKGATVCSGMTMQWR